MSGWIVVDDRPLDADVVERATATQSSLGELLARLRDVGLPQMPCPDTEEVPPWPW